MARYLKLFNNHASYEEYIGSAEAAFPNVSHCILEDDMHYNREAPPHDYSKDCLTFNILSDGYLCFTCDNTAYTKTIQYSVNNGEWTSLTSNINTEVSTAITVNGLSGTFTYGGYDGDMSEYYWENNGTKLFYGNLLITEGESVHDIDWNEFEVLTSEGGFVGTKINVVNGDIIQFRGNNTTYTDEEGYGNYFNVSCNFAIEGNIMSLIDSENFATATTLATDYTFYKLFYSCTGLTSAENLVLPATTLANYCYESMFEGCTSLTSAPVLPATTLAYNCYGSMFNGCTSLTSAPALPATTLAYGCYGSMFNGCTSLTSAPVLPATTLADYCYNNMFVGCTSLTSTPELPATTLAQSCYYGMFEGCTSLTSAPALPATTLANYCYDYMFQGCTSLTSAPSLPATTLADYCYERMFSGCISLTTAPELPATTLADGCYSSMFKGCTNLNYIKCLATDISAEECTWGWVNGVSSTGTFVKDANMPSWPTGEDGIPANWSVQDAS